MKLLLVVAAILAVGHAAEEQKAQAILINPGYYGGYPGSLYPYTYGLPHYAAPGFAPVTYTTQSLPATAVTVKAAPETKYETPVVAVAPTPAVYAPTYAVPTFASNQFAAQDELGNHNYGYSNVNSAKHEFGNSLTGVQGSYQYVDANGQLQTVSYVADGLGFRTADSRLQNPVVADLKAPVFNLEAPVFEGKAPEPVQDTAEVAEAKAAFFKTFEEAKNREKRESDPQIVYGYNTGFYYPGYVRNPYFYNNLLAYNNLGYFGHPRFAYNYVY